MRKIILGFSAAAFLSGALLAVPSEQQVAPGSKQNQNDVPKPEPGKHNPDLKQQKRPHTRHRKSTTPEHVNPGDVPHSQPGKKSPDMKRTAPGTTPDTSGQSGGR